MKRRTKVRFTQIHVSVPVRLLEDFDEQLAFTQSRSAKVSQLMEWFLTKEGTTLAEAKTRQLMAALMDREDCPSTLKMLIKIDLNAQRHGGQSS